MLILCHLISNSRPVDLRAQSNDSPRCPGLLRPLNSKGAVRPRGARAVPVRVKGCDKVQMSVSKATFLCQKRDCKRGRDSGCREGRPGTGSIFTRERRLPLPSPPFAKAPRLRPRSE